MSLSPFTKKLIVLSLREDIGSGDITSDTLIPSKTKARADLIAKSTGILSGVSVIDLVFRTVDSRLKINWFKREGMSFKKGDVILQVSGKAKSILKGERTALNFLSRLSGIATLTRQFVRKIQGTKSQILDTRKTTPLWREFEKNAVRAGGGVNHRFGLYDEVLVKDNHWIFVNSQAIGKKIKQKRNKRWIVEISKDTLHELVFVMAAKPDIILLDNFSSREIKKIVNMIHRLGKHFKHIPAIEASGGIHLSNVRQFAQAGVDRISIGSLTHSAPAIDFSLEVRVS